MSELPGLFNEYPDSSYREESEDRSLASKVIITLITSGLVGAFAVIAYFGIGPMLIKPYTPPIQSAAPDVTEVLGINNNQQSSGLVPITDEQTSRQLAQRLASEVEIAADEEIVTLLVDQLPKHDPQSIFAQAIKNDVLLILRKQGMAYLYRPSEDKIIDSGQVTAEN